MDLAKVKGITDWPTPRTVKQVQGFLGFCNFYRRFIKNFSDIACALFGLTREEVPFIWASPQETSFRTLIQAFVTAPVLALPDHSRPFWLITNANDFTTGTILEQPDALNRWHPIVYHSKSLQPVEQNYKIHDKELLAIVCALEIFHHYLEGQEDTIEVWSDHGNLVYFFTKQKLTCHQAHWALFLSHFKFIIIYKPGIQNKSDALSRRPDHKEGMALEEGQVLLDTKFFAIQAVHPTAVTVLGGTSLHQQIKSSQEYDKEVSQALEIILKNGLHPSQRV